MLIISKQVEVSSPSAESENTLCTNTLLKPTMCLKLNGSGNETSATTNVSMGEDTCDAVITTELPNSNKSTNLTPTPTGKFLISMIISEQFPYFSFLLTQIMKRVCCYRQRNLQQHLMQPQMLLVEAQS